MLMSFKCMLTGALLTRISNPPKNLGSRRFRGGTCIQGHVPHTQDLGAAKTNKVNLGFSCVRFKFQRETSNNNSSQLNINKSIYCQPVCLLGFGSPARQKTNRTWIERPALHPSQSRPDLWGLDLRTLNQVKPIVLRRCFPNSMTKSVREIKW